MVENVFMKYITGLQELRNMNIYLMHYVIYTGYPSSVELNLRFC